MDIDLVAHVITTLFCLISLAATFFYTVDFIIAIRLRKEIISLNGFFLITIAIASLILTVFTGRWIVSYILFNDQQAIGSLIFCLAFTVNLFLGSFLIRVGLFCDEE